VLKDFKVFTKTNKSLFDGVPDPDDGLFCFKIMLNYSTTIDAFKTIGEIQGILSRHNARRVVIEYENQLPIALTFGHVSERGIEISFRLPCNFKGIQKACEKKKLQPRFRTQDQAIRIGWRVIKDWLEAQLSMVEAELATTTEVFLPYAITKMGGKTMFELSQEPGSLLLEM